MGVRTSAPVSSAEVALFAVAALALATVRVAVAGGPTLDNDSYQYLSIAENLHDQHALATSIIHFDAERATGIVPAPVTTFPAGYSILLWALAWTCIPAEYLGLLLSAASFAVVVPILALAARLMRLDTFQTRLCLVGWIVNSQAALFATNVNTESVFTTIAFASFVVVLMASRDENITPWAAPVASFLAMAAFWTRYAGLFLIATLHVHALLLVGARPRRHWPWIPSLAVADVGVAVVLVRNAVVAGTWMGGNSRPVHHSVSSVLFRFVIAAIELAVGPIQRPRPAYLVLIAAAMALAAAGVAVCARARKLAVAIGGREIALVVGYIVVYCGAIAYLGTVTQITIEARMFLPLLPLVLLAIAVLLSAEPVSSSTRTRTAARVLVGSFMVAYALAGLGTVLRPARYPEHRFVADALALPMANGVPLARWLEETIPPDATIVSVEGQATEYVFHRNTISVTGRDFTNLVWDEAEMRDTMARFGAWYLVVYPDVVAKGATDHLDSELLRRLLAGNIPPWLELVAENPKAMVFRRTG